MKHLGKNILLLAAALPALFVPAYAADKYMSAAGGAVWDGSSFDWGTSPAGPFNTAAWVDYDYAHFAGTGGTVTLNTNRAANYVYFDADGYTVSGTGLINFGNPANYSESLNVGAGYTAIINTINPEDEQIGLFGGGVSHMRAGEKSGDLAPVALHGREP